LSLFISCDLNSRCKQLNVFEFGFPEAEDPSEERACFVKDCDGFRLLDCFANHYLDLFDKWMSWWFRYLFEC
jgi:hypothetical protein